MERSQDETFKIIETAVSKMVDFIKPTFGPSNRKVLTDGAAETLIVDDGYRLAIDFKLDDPLEMAIVKIIKANIKRLNMVYGEGTTGFLILVQAIIRELSKVYDKNKAAGELTLAVEDVKKVIKKAKKDIKTKQDIKNIALISYNNEPIVEMVADFLYKSGISGVLGIEFSNTQETFIDQMDGYEFNCGYIDQSLPRILTDAPVLLTDKVLHDGEAVVHLMDSLINSGKRELVIIAKKIEGSARATIIKNNADKVFHTLAIELSDESILADIQLVTGGKIYIDALELNAPKGIELKNLGHAVKALSQEYLSFIMGKKSKALEAECKRIRADLKKNPSDIGAKRLAKLSNTHGIIKIGSPTPNETIAIQYKVDDVIHAIKQAQKGGMVKGAGLTLYNTTTSSPLLNNALKQPFKQLNENCNTDYSARDLKSNEAINFKTGKIGDYLELGIVDPANVLIGQVETAVSTCALLAALSGIQAEPIKKE